MSGAQDQGRNVHTHRGQTTELQRLFDVALHAHRPLVGRWDAAARESRRIGTVLFIRVRQINLFDLCLLFAST